jgi:cytoskeletal protein CcmA (bactofilin family)
MLKMQIRLLSLHKLKNNKIMAKTQEVEHNRLNVIGEGTSIQGDIQSNGDIRIDGVLKGNLTTQGKLVIGGNGKIQGEIQCKNAELSGSIDGKITVNELLTLKSSATVQGDIITKKLAIEPNAIFTGTCQMDAGQPGVASKHGKEK